METLITTIVAIFCSAVAFAFLAIGLKNRRKHGVCNNHKNFNR